MASRPVVLLTGASGRLGKRIEAEYLNGSFLNGSIYDLFMPTRGALDLLDARSVARLLDAWRPTVIIHAAGYVNTVGAETDHRAAWAGNVITTGNLLHAANRHTRFVYISSEYVFDGTAAPYQENDPPAPINYYGFTKAIAEQLVLNSGVHNNLVLRIPFRMDPPWDFAEVLDDQYGSGRTASEVAPDILAIAQEDHLTGILHVGGPRRSLYEWASIFERKYRRTNRQEVFLKTGTRIPEDTSLDSSRWEAWKAGRDAR